MPNISLDLSAFYHSHFEVSLLNSKIPRRIALQSSESESEDEALTRARALHHAHDGKRGGKRCPVLKIERQACYIKFKLRDFTSCLCSAAAWAVCFEGSVAGVKATEAGNEVSQPTLELTSLTITFRFSHECMLSKRRQTDDG